jgi:hypothetical protein
VRSNHGEDMATTLNVRRFGYDDMARSALSTALVNEAGRMYAIATTERLSDARQSPPVEAGPS